MSAPSTNAYAEAHALHPQLPRRVQVIDCTLRDGEQAPGVAFSVAEKIALAQELSSAGVAVLDAGFPAASGADLEAIQGMRALGLTARVAATARAVEGDIAAAERARASDVFLFMPTSDFRIQETLGLSRTQVELRLQSSVEDAVGRGMGVSLVFEDATRADPGWMASLALKLCARVPLQRLVLADTVGRGFPARTQALYELLQDRLRGAVPLCAHSHNDFGLAVANTLASVAAGATAITVTVNGIGERAGNADLAETVAALTWLYGVEHDVDPSKLPALSSFVERISGIHLSAHKPVTGFNVFRHESGVHVDGMLKDARSYEFLPPRWVGRETGFVLGKHSGMSGIRHLLSRRGEAPDEARVHRLVTEIKHRAEDRDRTGHADAYRQHVGLQRRLLSGIDGEALLRELEPVPGASAGQAQAHVPVSTTAASARSERRD